MLYCTGLWYSRNAWLVGWLTGAAAGAAGCIVPCCAVLWSLRCSVLFCLVSLRGVTLTRISGVCCRLSFPSPLFCGCPQPGGRAGLGGVWGWREGRWANATYMGTYSGPWSFFAYCTAL